MDGSKTLNQLLERKRVFKNLNTSLADRCEKAMVKKINDLEASEIRLLLSQKLGSQFILPIAIDILENDPLIETEFYKGDLAVAVFSIDLKSLDLGTNLKTRIFELKIELDLIFQTLKEDLIPLISETNLFENS